MSASKAVSHNNPFPGLRPFREEEEYLFFGRESQVDTMVDKLAATRLLAVVGTSGSGKSSLVNCGLLPALHGGLMAAAGTAWCIAKFRPGGDPLHQMARALAARGVLFNDDRGDSQTLIDIVLSNLQMSKLGLIDIVEQARLGEGVNLLLIVDQFEELFRYWQLRAGDDESGSQVREEATAFVNLLLEAAAQRGCPIYVALTMRSDFLGDCAQFPGLAEAINAGQYLVPRMTRDERRAAIRGPIGVGGAEISPLLLTRLVNDVGDNPDQLSILQHALNRSWAYWQNQGAGEGPLDLAHYEAIGSMAHALDRHADKAYEELTTDRQREICEKLFRALTDKATDARGIRRPTTMSTLCALAAATPEEVAAVIDVFRKPSRSFLMPPAGEALEPATMIDISHESLLRVWRRLDAWADEERRSAWDYRRLAEAAERHAQGRASLWRDPDLQLALDWRDDDRPNETWAARYHPGFAAAMAFLEQSREARDAEREEREARRRLELRRARILSAILGTAALITLVFGLTFWQLENKALKSEKKALDEAQTARAALEFLENLFGSADPDKTRGKDITAGELLAEGRKKIEHEKNPKLKARMMDTMGVVYRKLGEYRDSESLHKKAVEISKDKLGAEHPDALKYTYNLAIVYSLQGHNDKAEMLHFDTLETRKRVIGADHPDTLSSMNGLAVVYHRKKLYEKAKPLYLEILETRKRVLGVEHPDTLQSMNNLAVLHDRSDENNKAENLHLETLQTRKRVLGDDHPDTLFSMNNLASLYHKQGDYEEAERLYLITLESRKGVLPPKHPETAITLYNLARVAALRGESTKAMKWLSESVAAGYADIEYITSDEGLKSLHGHPKFDALIVGLRKNDATQ